MPHHADILDLHPLAPTIRSTYERVSLIRYGALLFIAYLQDEQLTISLNRQDAYDALKQLYLSGTVTYIPQQHRYASSVFLYEEYLLTTRLGPHAYDVTLPDSHAGLYDQELIEFVDRLAADDPKLLVLIKNNMHELSRPHNCYIYLTPNHANKAY